MSVVVFKLHEHWQYVPGCIALLNSEWPKSETLRERLLRASCENLPMSFVACEDERVVGHLRLIKTQENALGVESVVVTKECRGTGIGRLLMGEAEKIARQYYQSRGLVGVNYLYLSTNEAQKFYEKCKYEITEAPPAFGNVVSNLNNEQLTGLAAMLQKRYQTSAVNPITTKKGEIWMRKKI